MFSFLRPNVDKLQAKGNVSGLIRVLASEDPAVHSDAVHALAKFGTGVLPQLFRALDHSNREVRKGAAMALGLIGHPGAVEPLHAVLCSDSDLHVLGSVLFSLGVLGDRRVVETLVRFLEHSDTVVRGQAARALARIGDARAIPFLCSCLEHTSYFLARMPDHWTSDHVRNEQASVAEAIESFGQAALVPLHRFTQCGRPDLERISTEIIAKVGVSA